MLGKTHGDDNVLVRTRWVDHGGDIVLVHTRRVDRGGEDGCWRGRLMSLVVGQGPLSE